MVLVNSDSFTTTTRKSFSPAQLLCMNKPTKSEATKINIQSETNKDKNVIILDDYDDDNNIKSPLPSSSLLKKKSSINLTQLLSGNQKRNNQKKETFIVKLKLPPNNIIKPSLIVNFKYKKSSKNLKIHPKSSSHPFFKAIIDKMNIQQNEIKFESNIIKPKILNLPKLNKSNFKIRNLSKDEEIYYNRKLSFKNIFPPKLNSILKLNFNDLDFLLFYSKYKFINDSNSNSNYLNRKINSSYIITTIDNDPNLSLNLIKQRYLHLNFDDRFNKFFQFDYCQALNGNNIDQWCDIYKPLDHQQNLQKNYISTNVFNWLKDSFSKFKTVNQSKRKKKLSKKKQIKEEFDSFIVYSDDEIEFDNYSTKVPCLIIEGPIGCGKTTLIHSIVEDELGGHVFEFNSNQSRSRKELEFNLKQIGTTTMLKQKKSVIMFDDVNLINEESDKDFWLSINDLLVFSYRPVILITNDIKWIPKNIVNESTIYKLNPIENFEIYQYLDLISLSRNLNLDSKILDKLSSFDLRKSLMELQMFSYKFDISNVGLTNITVINDNENIKDSKQTNLEKLNKVYEDNELKYFTNSIEMEMEIENEFEDKYEYEDEFENEYEYELNYNKFQDKINDNFKSDKISTIEFYVSKYFSNGSRSKTCRYMDADDYNKKHPANCFYSLPRDKLAVDLFSMIRVMAQKEFTRVQNNNPRRFELDPLEIYDDLFLVDV